MKCAIYARVSDDKKKADGERRQDVQRQVSELRAYAEGKGHESITEYIDDGKSAYTEDLNQRPAFKQMLNDVRRNFIQQIYIEDMTRFSRNLSMGLQWLKQLAQDQCNVTSLKEGDFETTSSRGWMQSSLLLMFSEWDSRIKSEKVKTGMQKAKSQGKHIGRRKKTKGCPNDTPPSRTKTGGTED